jgi:sterol desaturase/sphingolipid hydroxylase (fatty acid hydroxylase superfamily)
LHNNMHDSFHIRKTFWHKFPFFQKLIKSHYQHHINMGTNYGIFSFFWDKLFKTYKE